MLQFCVRPKLVCCSCVCRGLEARLCILPLILNLLWRGLLSNFSFPYGLLLSRAGLCLIVGFSFFSLLLYSFRGLAAIPAMLLCYSYCGVIWPQLVGHLLSLLRILLSIGYNDLVWSLGLYSHYFGLSWPITLLVGSFVPFLSSLGILGPFAFLGHPWPIF